MKALTLIILIPAMMLVGCGKMQTSETALANAVQELNSDGSISNEEANSINEELLSENLELAQTDSHSVLMKVGGAELLIEFIDQLVDDPEATALIINGIEVAQGIVTDSESFQALIASLVTSQLQGVDILGIPVNQLVTIGLQLISGDANQADFSNLFGVLIRGFLNRFLSGSPIGSIISNILGSILDGGSQTDGSNNGSSSDNGGNTDNSNNSNTNNNSGSVVGGIINTIGGVLAGSNPLLGGIISLISTLIK